MVERSVDLSPWQLTATVVVLATALAVSSSALVELPFRRAPRLDRAPRLVVAGGLCVSILCAFVVLPPVMEASRATTADPVAAGSGADLVLEPVPSDFQQVAIRDERFSGPVGCTSADWERCTVTYGPGPHVLLMGDSNAVMLQQAVDAMAEAEGLTFTRAGMPNCPWQQGYYYPSPDGGRSCDEARDAIYASLRGDAAPDLVIAVGVRPNGTERTVAFRGNDHDASLRRATASSVEQILATGIPLVVVEPLPRPSGDFDPLNCLASATYQEECRFATDVEPYWLEQDLRAMAEQRGGLHLVDLDRAACPRLPICEPIVDGVVVRWDAAHLTKAFALGLSDDITRELRSLDLLVP